MSKNILQISVDIGLQLEEHMAVWMGFFISFFISSLHTLVTGLDSYIYFPRELVVLSHWE